MKIMVFGHPRSGSSLAAHVLLNHYKLEGWGEVFIGKSKTEIPDIIDRISNADNILIKILSNDVPSLDLSLLDLSMFDKIYICERHNKIHAMLSLYAALKSGKTFWQNLDSFPFKVTKTEMIRWGRQMNHFYTFKELIIDSNIPYTHLWYEDITEDHRLILSGLEYDKESVDEHYRTLYIEPSKFDYARDCINYDEVCRWAGENQDI